MSNKLPDSISIKWCKEDVLDRAEYCLIECSDLQAREILQLLKKNHDSTQGVSWDTIDYYLSTL